MGSSTVLPFETLKRGKPDYLPSVLWEKLERDVAGWNLWYWRSCERLLFGRKSSELFVKLGRVPNSKEREAGAKQWVDDDYLKWFKAHCLIHANYISHDRHTAYHNIKHELYEIADQAESLAKKLSCLYQMQGALDGASDLLPQEIKRLSSLYQLAVHVNNERGGQALPVTQIAGYPDDWDATADELEKIRAISFHVSMEDERGHLPALSDVLSAVAESTRRHVHRFEADGVHGLTIRGYKPESLVARYVALFDAGFCWDGHETEPYKVLRVSHAAMSLQCSLVFESEITKERVIDIRKRAAATK